MTGRCALAIWKTLDMIERADGGRLQKWKSSHGVVLQTYGNIDFEANNLNA
jgi:hypothetical protein